jgi:hypothetical protein
VPGPTYARQARSAQEPSVISGIELENSGKIRKTGRHRRWRTATYNCAMFIYCFHDQNIITPLPGFAKLIPNNKI